MGDCGVSEALELWVKRDCFATKGVVNYVPGSPIIAMASASVSLSIKEKELQGDGSHQPISSGLNISMGAFSS